MEHLAGDIAVSDSGRSRFRLSFSEAPRHVVAAGLVTTQAHDHDDVQGSVGVAVEPVPDGLAAGSFQWAGSVEFGEGALAADPVVVVADGVRCWNFLRTLCERERSVGTSPWLTVTQAALPTFCPQFAHSHSYFQ